MIRVLYFASLKEALGLPGQTLDVLPATVGELRSLLAKQHHKAWQEAEGAARLLAAVNQEIADDDVRLGDGDEVAFFPPVTGG